MAAKAARLEAELKFHDAENKRTTTLKIQQDEIRLQMLKEPAAS